VIVALTTVVGVRPAHANETEDVARRACEANAGLGTPGFLSGPSQAWFTTTPGHTDFAPPGGLQRGDFIRVTVTGPPIDFDTWWPSVAGVWGPDGNGWPSPDLGWPGYSNDPSRNSSQYAAYGVFNRSGIRFRVGSDSGCLPYADLGTSPDNTVGVGINDTYFDDNAGDLWQFTVRFYRNPSAVQDGGFERQTSSIISAPWRGEGPDFKGIDVNRNLAFAGRNNAFIRTSSTNWNAVTQPVGVTANTRVRMQARIRTSANFYHLGFLGVRTSTGAVLRQMPFGEFNLGGYQQLTVPDFDTGPNTSLSAFVGYRGPGYDSWIQIDEVALFAVPA
jgi:hypothetical protein